MNSSWVSTIKSSSLAVQAFRQSADWASLSKRYDYQTCTYILYLY